MDGLENQFKDGECETHGQYIAKGIMFLGRPIRWTGCPECESLRKAKETEERAREQVLFEERQKNERLNQAGIPFRFRSRGFDNFIADTKPKNDALQAMREFADTFSERADEGSTYVLSGKPGTGKSHLAIAVCKHVMDLGYSVKYINALDAIRLVRSAWRKDSEKSESEVIADLSRLGLLVIDEVGMQYGTEGEQVILFDIINSRYQDQQPMILLTNQGKEGFRQYLGDRAFDRLREAGRWLAFDWESHRGIEP